MALWVLLTRGRLNEDSSGYFTEGFLCVLMRGTRFKLNEKDSFNSYCLNERESLEEQSDQFSSFI